MKIQFYTLIILLTISSRLYSQTSDTISLKYSKTSIDNSSTKNYYKPIYDIDSLSTNTDKLIKKFKHNSEDKEYSDDYKKHLNIKYKIIEYGNDEFQSIIKTKQLIDLSNDLDNKKSLGKYIQFDFDTQKNKYPFGVVCRIINDPDVLFFKFENGKGGLGHLIVSDALNISQLESDLEDISSVDFR